MAGNDVKWCKQAYRRGRTRRSAILEGNGAFQAVKHDAVDLIRSWFVDDPDYSQVVR